MALGTILAITGLIAQGLGLGLNLIAQGRQAKRDTVEAERLSEQARRRAELSEETAAEIDRTTVLQERLMRRGFGELESQAKLRVHASGLELEGSPLFHMMKQEEYLEEDISELWRRAEHLKKGEELQGEEYEAQADYYTELQGEIRTSRNMGLGSTLLGGISDLATQGWQWKKSIS